MTLPTFPVPPTDNLYKFAAISGVVLFILAPVYWAGFYVAYKHQELAAFQTLFGAVASYDFYMDNAAAEAGKPITPEQKSRIEHQRAARQQANSTGLDYNLMAKFYGVVNGSALVFELAGLMLMYWGFNRWYYRVQEPLDKILQKQAKDFVKGNSEVENPS